MANKHLATKRLCICVVALVLLSGPAMGIMPPAPALAAPLPQQTATACDLVPPGGRIQSSDPACIGDLCGGGGNPNFCLVHYGGTESDPAVVLRVSIFPNPEEARFYAESGACTGPGIQKIDLGEYGCLRQLANADYNERTSSRGCYGVQSIAQPLSQSIQALAYHKEIDDKLKTMPACPGGAAPAVQPASTGPFTAVGGCTYNEPTYSSGELACAANTTNTPAGGKITYKWAIDGNVQSETGSTLRRADAQIAAGTHSVTVKAVHSTSKAESTTVTWQFTKPGTPPPPDFWVHIQGCHYQTKDDTIKCLAEARNTPEGAQVSYQWTVDNAAADTGNAMIYKIQQDSRLHNVQVRATVQDKVHGQMESTAVTSVWVGLPLEDTLVEAVELVTSQGTKLLDSGLISLGTLPSGQPNKAEVRARCDNVLYQTALFVMIYDPNPFSFTPGRPSWAEVIIGSALLKCAQLEKGKSAVGPAPRQLASLVPVPAESESAAQFRAEMLSGALRFEVWNEQVELEITTSAASIWLRGKSTASVAFDFQSGTTAVTVYEGQAAVEPYNPAVAPVRLSAGQAVQMTESSMEPVITFPAGKTVNNMGNLLIGLGTVVLVPVALAVIGLVLWRRSRRRRQTAPVRRAAQGRPKAAGPAVPPATPAAAWYCTRCGDGNLESDRFCGACGAPRPVVVPAEWACGRCGQLNRPETRFCGRCGTARQQT